MPPGMFLVSPKCMLHGLAHPLLSHFVSLSSAILPSVELYAGPLNFRVFASGGDWFVEGNIDEVESEYEPNASELVEGSGVSAKGGHVAGNVQQGDVCRSFIWSLLSERLFVCV